MQKVHLGSIYHKYIQNIAVELLKCHRQEQLRKKGLKRPGGGVVAAVINTAGLTALTHQAV